MSRPRRLLAVGLLALIALLFLVRNARTDVQLGTVIAIDLGAAYSRVGVMKNGDVEILVNDHGNRMTPSYVAFTKDGCLVGESAKIQAAANPSNTVSNVKHVHATRLPENLRPRRLIGRKFNELDDIQRLPYTVVSNHNKPNIQVEVDGKSKLFTPEEILAKTMSKMKEIAEGYLGDEVTPAVVTVPASYDDKQRQATKKAANIAGIKILRVIDEPTAAVIPHSLAIDGDEHHVIVYDLGVTFDVTLLSLDGGVIEVLATASDAHVGGEEFDQRTINFFVDLYNKKNIDITKDPGAIGKLEREIEKAKHILSSQTSTHIEIKAFFKGRDFSENLTRAKLEELNMDLFKKTITLLDQVLKEANISKSKVDDIILIGGASRIPMAQYLVKEYFNGKKPMETNTDYAVTIGAAIQAGITSGTYDTGCPEPMDVASLGLGIETAGGVMTTLIPRNSRMPVRRSQVFEATAENQRVVLIRVFEGERSMTKHNTLLGELELPVAPASAPPRIAQIEISFAIDANGLLQVLAADTGTGKQDSITIHNTSRQSGEEIDRLVIEADKFAEEDRAVRRQIECGRLGDFPYSLRSLVNERASNCHDEL